MEERKKCLQASTPSPETSYVQRASAMGPRTGQQAELLRAQGQKRLEAAAPGPSEAVTGAITRAPGTCALSPCISTMTTGLQPLTAPCLRAALEADKLSLIPLCITVKCYYSVLLLIVKGYPSALGSRVTVLG